MFPARIMLWLLQFCLPNAKRDHFLYRRSSFLAFLMFTLTNCCSSPWNSMESPLLAWMGWSFILISVFFWPSDSTECFQQPFIRKTKKVFSSTNMFSRCLNCTFILHSASKSSSRAIWIMALIVVIQKTLTGSRQHVSFQINSWFFWPKKYLSACLFP